VPTGCNKPRRPWWAASSRLGSVRLADGGDTLATGATRLRDGARQAATGARQLRDGLRDGLADVPALDTAGRHRVAEAIADPVAVTSHSGTPDASNMATISPFLLAFATWIGAGILFLVARPLARQGRTIGGTPLRATLGGWLAPVVVGLGQATVMLGVVALTIDLAPQRVPQTWLFLALTSATCVAVVQMLQAWAGRFGKSVGLGIASLLLVLQLVSAGGILPWQTLPAGLWPLHHVLPMSYSVDGLRQLMFGGSVDRVVHDALVLAVWLVAALTLTTLAASQARRRGIDNSTANHPFRVRLPISSGPASSPS
jgi:putative membrane protein